MKARFDTRATCKRVGNDDGFTLVELLIVMLIIGILAAVAIPILLTQKSKGYGAQMKSDLHEAAVAEEGYAQDHNGIYLTSGTGTDLANEGFAATNGVTVTLSAPTSGSGGFCLIAQSANFSSGSGSTQWYTNQGADGGVITLSRPTNC